MSRVKNRGVSCRYNWLHLTLASLFVFISTTTLFLVMTKVVNIENISLLKIGFANHSFMLNVY
ncbi:hypothetical protein CJP72_16210 [Citrobacter sp. NCU1]|nr:hypothetical protein [Citrobacter sp. NCU1]